MTPSDRSRIIYDLRDAWLALAQSGGSETHRDGLLNTNKTVP